MLQEFKKFAMRGNVMDMAIGIILGGAFGKIVASLVSDVLMPPLGLLLGRVDFTNLFWTLSKGEYATLADAQAAGAATINYGVFVNAVVNFVIIAFAIFIVVKQMNRMSATQEQAPPPPSEKDCPFCLSRVPIKAVRCAHCTSELPAS